MVSIKSKREIELMSEACRITAKTYEMLEKNIKPGMSTHDLDQMAENKHVYCRIHSTYSREVESCLLTAWTGWWAS